MARDGYDFIVKILYKRYEYLNFWCIAAFRDTNYHVIILYNAQIAVYGVCGVHKNGRCSRRIHRGDYFLRDYSTFTYTCYNNSTVCMVYVEYRFRESIIYTILERCNGLSLYTYGAFTYFDNSFMGFQNRTDLLFCVIRNMS